MAPFLDLPSECIIHVFLFLAPYHVPRCRLISRAFWAIINDSLKLQYLMELDRLGLVPPPPSSNEQPLYEKVCALREKRPRTGSRDIDNMTSIYLYPWDHGNLIVEPCRKYTFSRGVFAFQGEDWPHRLGIYQFTSQNRGIDCDRYMVKCPPDIWMMAVEPSFDLLILFGGDEEKPVFYIRSLQTGLPHPAALHPTILASSPTGIRISRFAAISIQIVGRRIIHMREIREPMSSLVTIWDWITGDIVTSTKVLGYSCAFLSEDVFLVPAPIQKGSNPYPLALYTCLEVPPGHPARLLALLQLPTPDTIQVDHARLRGSILPSVWDCPIPLVSPPRSYDTSSTEHYLALVLGFPTHEWGTLFVHASNLLSLVDRLVMDGDSDCPSIHWKDWSSVTSWINETEGNIHWTVACRNFGPLATCLRKMDGLDGWRIDIYDLRLTKRKVLPELQLDVGPASSEETDSFSDSSIPIRRPLLVKSFTVPLDIIPRDDYWYEGTDHNRGVDLMVSDEHSEYPLIKGLDQLAF